MTIALLSQVTHVRSVCNLCNRQGTAENQAKNVNMNAVLYTAQWYHVGVSYLSDYPGPSDLHLWHEAGEA